MGIVENVNNFMSILNIQLIYIANHYPHALISKILICFSV